MGNLFSCDHQTNLVPRLLLPIHVHMPTLLLQVLEGAIERVIRPVEDEEPSQEVPLGLYIIRGDNVCVVGLVDEALDESINWAEVRGEVIGTTKHS